MHASHLVLATAVLFALGILIVLVVHATPAGTGSARQASPPAQRARPEGQRTREKPPSPAPGASIPSAAPAQPDVVRYRYKVVKSYPHDRRSFTQGLVYEDGSVYEGTGLHGQSALFQRDLQTGRTVKMLRLADQHFGEGITILGDKLLQLTWQSHVGFVYRKDTFTPLREFTYTGEGWGLTHDGRRLILSDGTATLRFLDPNTYAETGRIEVRDQGRPVERLNELEFVADGPLVGQSAWRGRPALASRGHPDLALPGQDTSMAYEVQGPGSPNAIRSRLGTHDALATKEQGRDALATKGTLPQAEGGNGLLYANIWPTDRIAIIDPKTGRVTGWIDLSGLYTPRANEQGDSVLNGIAYLPKTRHLLVTGKLWPRLYEIELIPQPQGKHDR